MHKKILFLLCLALSCACFFSCKNNDDDESDSNQQEQTPSEKVSVSFVNDSSFSVNVFVNAHRKMGGEVLVTLSPSESKDIPMYPSTEKSGYPFYFEYLIPIGSVSFPYFSFDNSQVYKVESGKKNEIKISELVSCKEKSSYLLLENNSDSTIYLSKGGAVLTPETASNSLLDNGKDGVYLIGQNSLELYLTDSTKYQIRIGANTVSLPEIKFDMGKIYTVSVSYTDNEYSTSLKSISPFDIDTRRQIWSSKDISPDESPYYSVNCVRSAYDAKDGSFYAGSVSDKTNVIFIEAFDVYGKVKMKNQFIIDKTNENSEHPVGCYVIDAVQTSVGNYLLLINQYFDSANSDTNAFYYILSVDSSGNEKVTLDLSKFAQSHSFENVWFYGNICKGALCPIDNDKCGIFGSVWNESGEMYQLAAVADFSSSTPAVENYWTSSESSDFLNGVYRTFTSGWYDSTSSSFYAAGYNNFSEDYQNPQHSGVIYKVPLNCSTVNEEASFGRTLFFGITGKNGKYYACGETMGSTSDGNLYGGFISKDMVDSSSEIIRYRSTKENTYFTQINFTNNGIALCGSNSSSMDFASDDTEGILTCFSTTGTKLWENNYSDYHTISSMAENNIGTQILHVVKTDGTSKILSTDLLGRECK